MISLKSYFTKNNLKLILFNNNKIIGNINTSIKNDPIVIEHNIDNNFKKRGYGDLLLKQNEKILFKEYNNIYLNLWCYDRCYFNYLNFYSSRNYSLENNNNLIEKIDYEDNIYYNLFMKKNK
jgi:hypothetical protein